MKNLEIGEFIYFRNSHRYSLPDYTVDKIIRLTKTLAIGENGSRFKNTPSSDGSFRQAEALSGWHGTIYARRLDEAAKLKIEAAKEVKNLNFWWSDIKSKSYTTDQLRGMKAKLKQ